MTVSVGHTTGPRTLDPYFSINSVYSGNCDRLDLVLIATDVEVSCIKIY